MSVKDVSLRFVEPLFEVKELHHFILDRKSKDPLRSRHGAAASAIFKQWTRLADSIERSAGRLGLFGLAGGLRDE